MDIDVLIEEMDEIEKVCFGTGSASDYYHMVLQMDAFSRIEEKLNTNDSLEDTEWDFILTKLYLISCKALLEEDRVDFVDRIIYLFSKIGVKVGKKDSPFYNECYKMMEYIQSISKEKEMNLDTLTGLDIVIDSCCETDLDILLQQYRESCIFRDHRDGFEKAYQESMDGVISSRERVCINCFNRAYDREKQLLKKYGVSKYQ